MTLNALRGCEHGGALLVIRCWDLMFAKLQLHLLYVYFLATFETYKVYVLPRGVCGVIRGLPVTNPFFNVFLDLAHSFPELFWNLLCISSVSHIGGKEK